MFRSSLVAGCFIALTLAPTAAQQPTQAQRDAVRAACRSDFMANCAGVQPGGKEALECLLRNDAKLAPPCRSAVSAIAAPASSPAAPAAAAPPRPGDASASAHGQSSTPAPTPPSAKISHPATAPAQKARARSARRRHRPHRTRPQRRADRRQDQPQRLPSHRLDRYGRCYREERL